MTDYANTTQEQVGAQWQRYVAEPSDLMRNKLLMHYLPVAQYHARRIRERLPRCYQVDDLMQSAVLGLRSAIDSFDPQRGIRFETYCTLRVRGAILDNLKDLFKAPRDMRTRAAALDRAKQQLRMTLGRTPSEVEIAHQLSIAKDKTRLWAQEAVAAAVTSLDVTVHPRDLAYAQSTALDNLEDPHTVDPADRAQRADLKDLLMRTLTQVERLILMLYYYEDMTMREIALTLGRTEARVSQIHSRVLERLRTRFAARFHESASPRESTVDL